MTETEFNTWLSEMRSGKYTQCRGALRDGDARCAVAIAYDITGRGILAFIDEPPAYQGAWGYAINLNDVEKKTLPEIADILEKEYGSS